MYEPYYDEQDRTLFFVDGAPEKKDYFGGVMNVFSCGVLQSPSRMKTIIGHNAPFAPAVAFGFTRRWEKVKDKDYFFMISTPDKGERVLTGIIWLDLTRDDVKRIETFELQENVRRRVTIKVQVGDRFIDTITYIKR